jgi:hypothetical protein
VRLPGLLCSGQMGSNASPRLEFEEVEVDSPAGTRVALVVSAAEKIRIGRGRLERIRDGDPSSPVDDEIVRCLTSWPRSVDVVLLRSWAGSEDRSWGFDPTLEADELHELAYTMMRGQLALYRRLLVHRVFALVSTDLTTRDFDALVQGAFRLSGELTDKIATNPEGSEVDRIDRIDRWILDHFSLWTTRPFHEFVVQGVPRVFSLVERYTDELHELSARARTVSA